VVGILHRLVLAQLMTGFGGRKPWDQTPNKTDQGSQDEVCLLNPRQWLHTFLATVLSSPARCDSTWEKQIRVSGGAFFIRFGPGLPK